MYETKINAIQDEQIVLQINLSSAISPSNKVQKALNG